MALACAGYIAPRQGALLSMIGSPGWFAKLRSWLPTLMNSDDPQLSWEILDDSEGCSGI